MLDYLTRKDKPLSYIETHAGRASYDLDAEEARKTGEAAMGIARVQDWFAPDHPFAQVLHQTRAEDGPHAYPGSPMIAARLLRPTDTIHLAELHPREHGALEYAMSPYPVTCHRRDGFDLAHSLLPPTPRRGMLLIDPSYEIKEDYDEIPRHIAKYTRAWNVGIVALWYPVLTSALHVPMLKSLVGTYPDALRAEVRFPPARPGHGMIGAGLFVINPPYGLDAEAKRLKDRFDQL
ncbi:23S rRNA (adenine(2030)-N(6))-methyltransferase RlmJ [Photobacterium sp. TY 1-4]|uniref:23S rRNA (Adenine(2030)-N(6))-methyltransferase RlmJ n=2 Tax=Pseudosulfitobacter koreensis TaxID=2968472 RepID=A0ABT1YYM1_9RHOB|nr:23S rRNA (adenine(2030)-N(6))-methyltransferase RlmJ [Pseudosulfitobacter koreense]